jgi:hypothetical protein
MVLFFFVCFCCHVPNSLYIFYMFCVFYVTFPETGIVESILLKVFSVRSYLFNWHS